MDSKQILDLYNKGFSLNFITNQFLKEENSQHQNYYAHDGNYIINKNRITKAEAGRYVSHVILSQHNKC